MIEIFENIEIHEQNFNKIPQNFYSEHICNGKNISLDNAVYINAVLAGVKSADYIMANKIRTKIMKQVKNIFQQFDYIITPTSGTGPTLISPKDHTCKFNN